MESLLRIAAQQPSTMPNVVAALKGLPAGDVEIATIIKLRPLDPATYRPVLEAWKVGANDEQQLTSIGLVETAWSGGNGN